MDFRYLFRLMATAGLLFLGGFAASGASAQEAASPFKSFLGFLGFQSRGGDESESIDYRARAPIVVPPRFDLPQPKEVARDPSWPKDPDIAAERRSALDSHTPAAQAAANSQQGGGSLPADGPKDECEAGSGMALCLATPWKSLKSMTNLFHSETAQLGPEPTRKLLTEPPAGYRQPAGDGKVAGELPKSKPDPAAHDRPHLPGSSF